MSTQKNESTNPEKKNYKDTLNLPQTTFAMEAKLVTNEPVRLAAWKQVDLYRQILVDRQKSGKGRWVLHDGPPFANGDIHIGHLINKTLKDIIIKFRSMQGYETPYVPGWDCHGLPIEHKIQEEVKKAGKDFRAMSTVEVRQLCYASAEHFAAAQSDQFQRLGILGDWENPYLTMKPEYEAETLEVFARFVEAGLVYKQLKPVPWSVASQTALADAELEYEDVEDASVYVEFPLDPACDLAKSLDRPAYFLVWTTTPWTLPANLAIAVNEKVRYVFVEYTRAGEKRLGIIASELQEKVFGLGKDVTDVKVTSFGKTGEELAAETAYLHPFIDYKGKIVTADYVTTTDGTGMVHTAPGHGEDDYDTGRKYKLPVYCPVLASGRFDDTVPEFIKGKTTKEGNKLITAKLEETGRLFAEVKITHSYPHDWRTKTPIIFRATEQWFIAIDRPFLLTGESGKPASIRARATAVCEKGIEFIPAWGQARLRGMLSSRPDWCISRQRAWGLPIPVFYNDKGEALLTPASVRAVAKKVKLKGSDIWFTESPDQLLSEDPSACPASFGKASELRKERDIFDVWFESGSSWGAVAKARPNLAFPADMYLEGSDQHRGWFQLSLLASLGATGKAPYKQVLTHGFVVKPDGKKVSKSDKEYVKAVDEINRHGADVLRLWCSSVDYQNDIPASPQVLKDFGDKYRKIRNTLRYLLSNVSDFNPATDKQKIPATSLDGWIMFELDQLIVDVNQAYDSYQLHRVFRLLHDFCAVQISAVYGNAMKDRLYCEAINAPIRRRSQTAMYQMVIVLAKLAAPIIVFTADEVWEHIPHKTGELAGKFSVHLARMPEAGSMVAMIDGAVTEQQKADWKQLMALRDEALGQLDKMKKEAGMNKALDAEVIYHVPDESAKQKLLAYGIDLEDLVSCGCYAISVGTGKGNVISVEAKDRRNDYPACARSWKRRKDVGSNPAYPDLSARDAAAMVARG